MSKAILPRKAIAPLYAFEPECLHVESDLDWPLSQCQDILNLSNFEMVVGDLLTKRNLLALVISVIGDTPPLYAWIMSRFPTSASSFANSVAYKILQDISLSLSFLDYLFPDDVKCDIRKHRRSVELGAPVILALIPLLESTSLLGDEVVQDNMSRTKTNRETQRKAKRTKKLRYLVDDAPFRRFDVSVPGLREEAESLISDILAQQMAAMEFYFTTLQHAGISDELKKLFIPQSNPVVDVVQRISDQVILATAEEPSQDESRSAYPMVQPMKAALYFDSAKDFGEWRILVSSDAIKDLRENRRKNHKLFRIILKKIRELSNGHFSDDNQKKLNGSSSDIPIYEAKMARDSRLVYTIDCVPDFNSNFEQQVIRIFGIYTHAQLNTKSWDSISKQLTQKGREYKRRCNFRNRTHHAGDNVIQPAQFPAQTDTIPEPLCNPLQLPQEDLDDLHSLLVLNKYVTFSQECLNSIIADQDVNHVFHVSMQEKEIIEHMGSCYVLGRSGTGKTTTMLFKMLGLERLWSFETHKNETNKPRQVFVTKSRVLADKVSEYFMKLLDSLSTAGSTPEELVKLAEKTSQRGKAALVDRDEEKHWRQDIPSKFSLLQDGHFPLFITFDDLCDLIEGDIAVAQSAIEDSASDQMPIGSSRKHRWGRKNLITYTDFLRSYWPHFSQTLTKGMNPSLVFSEIMGTIQGSYGALMSKNHFLDQTEYENFSVRAQPMFASQRNTVYSLFQLYLKHKRQRGEYDVADRAHHIVDYMRNNDVLSQKIDFLYVDEAQDNLLVDAFVLRSLCRNPNGLFWAGDTAQTISIGSSFRFDDLKSLLFRIENEKNGLPNQDTRRKQLKEPQTFQLMVNYRSHGGIVNAAHSIIQLIMTFWPYSIDNLPQEKGVVDGLKPVFFRGWDQDTVRYEQFLFGDSKSHIEFGADQCILVRDDDAKDRLRREVGDVGIIMTIYEAKGLEFGDVLLYNFFQDSLVGHSQWRVVLNAIEESTVSSPTFDENHHAGVCSELKSLYVAITRARKNMWIADCSGKSESMRAFWDSKNLVQNCTPGDDVPRLAVSSSAAEWAEQGEKLFHNKRYSQAIHCYERASRPREAAVANAFFLREKARNTPVGRRDAIQSSKAFLEAANAFSVCDGDAEEKRVYLKNAGECFAHAGDNRRAAESYLAAEEFTQAAQHYHKGSMVDDAVNVVLSHRNQIENGIAETIICVARIFYFKEDKMDQAKDLFESYEESLEFTKDFDLDVARGTLLESRGRLREAAELHLEEGRTLEAIDLLLKDKDNLSSIHRGHECILQGLWRHLSFGVLRESVQGNDTVIKLLQLAGQLDAKQLDQNAAQELSMFQAIFSGDLPRLQQLGHQFHANKNTISALLCLDHYFLKIPQLETLPAVELSTILDTFSVYAWLLNYFMSVDPGRDRSAKTLFCIGVSAENLFLIPVGTFLHGVLIKRRPVMLQQNEKAAIISMWELSMIFKESLGERLRLKVSEENLMCRQAKALSPCLTFGVYGTCRRDICTSEHGTTDPKSYNLRVRLHLQQISIYQTLHAIEWRSELLKHRSHWISRLYDTLKPAYHSFGTHGLLDNTTIPESERGFRIVDDLVRYVFYSLNAVNAPRRFLTLYMKAADFCFSTGSTTGCPDYLNRLPCMAPWHTPDSYKRQTVAHNVMWDLLDNLSGSRSTCLHSGVIFLKHIVQKMLQVDVGVLCNFVDQLCMSFIAAERYRQTASLHAILVPRNWLALVQLSDESCKRDTRPYFLFTLVDVLAEILKQIYASSSLGHLLLDARSSDLSKLGPAIRGIFIDRICTALCLLGYNIYSLRDRITAVIMSFRDADSQFPSYCQSRYAYNRDWAGMVNVVRPSAQNSPFEEMIQLCHESKKLVTIPSARQIIYSNIKDIPSLVYNAHFPQKSLLRAEALPFIPSVRATSPVSDNKKEVSQDVRVISTDGTLSETPLKSTAGPEPAYTEDIANDEEAFDEQALETTGITDSFDMPLPPMDPESGAPFDREIRAAVVIGNAYKRVLSRRNGVAKTGMAASRASIYDNCYAEAQKMDWPNRHYRLLFLGPLVHALLCVEEIYSLVSSLKDKTKKRIKDAVYDKLEELTKTQTELTAFQKAVKELRENLKPQADLHRRRDIHELKGYIRELEALVNRLPDKPHQLEGDLRIAVRGIVEVRKVKKKQKPELCIDDIYDIYDI